MRLILPKALALGTACIAGIANASLFDRGNGLFYDDVLKVTWMQDANYAKTQYVTSAGTLGDADGKMNWIEATTWVQHLNFAGYDDWRLPAVSPVNGINFNLTYSDTGSADFGYNLDKSSSELAYMHYINLKNASLYAPFGIRNGCGDNLPDQCMLNTLPFSNIQPAEYWTGTEIAVYSDSVFHFNTAIGLQYGSTKTGDERFVWVVRDGDVTSVPEPNAFLIMLIGSLSLLITRNRYTSAYSRNE